MMLHGVALQVGWRRIVLDEGHVMGSSCDSNRALMCHQMQVCGRDGGADGDGGEGG